MRFDQTSQLYSMAVHQSSRTTPLCRFTAAYITCRSPPNSHTLTPLAVSVLVVAGVSCPVVSNTVLVTPPGPMSSEFTVCVTPLNFRYSRAYELVEWIELSRLLGADKFVFYNHSTGPNVDKVLQMYRSHGIVDIQPWDLPVQTDTWPPTKRPEIHYFAQIASLNDCLHRYQNRSRYLVYQDLDEYIIPKSVDTWAELIQDREKISGDISAFLFRCIFFRKEWPSPAKNFHKLAKIFNSVVLTYTRRESKWQLPGVRSKFIVNPRKTTSIGVHQVWEASSRVDYVPEEVARLHHYRNWDNPADTQPQVEDLLVAEKYGARLVERLQKAWSDLEGVPMDVNITIYGDFA
ncbi:unnamed protein product [Candidula unifasciata]|uniref:Glycosyltransferase family 92 protein n=1 Tax=Candidula unifasciata TaxID=100452 RepID=A0A8S3ZSG7_9EUPU|nr:unnamed protein product [Candidula unifasciata]